MKRGVSMRVKTDDDALFNLTCGCRLINDRLYYVINSVMIILEYSRAELELSDK